MKTIEKITSKRNNVDLPDTKDDIKHLQPEEAILDLPEVKDIPGQEHIRPILGGELADTTISSADEEAEDLLGEEDEIAEQYNSNVTKDERELLRRSSESMGTEDDLQLQQSALDNTDDEGSPLNEETDQSGEQLDVPGSEDDDADEKIGEEDEENNAYSLNDDKEDEINTRQ